MKFTLPISPEYVAHWGLWEAIREIYQNALDEQTQDPSCTATIEYDVELNNICIATTKGKLSPESLVLGKTSKHEDLNQRGKFGGGYKLALLVLCRLGLDVEIYTNGERWVPKLEHDETFNSTVLNIYTEPFEPQNEGVEFLIMGVETNKWEDIKKNIRPWGENYNIILEATNEKSRVYVGGLYVSTVKGFLSGYSFAPDKIKLDRDRGMIDGFDLAWATSNLWSGIADSRAVELLEQEAPDVQYVESQVHSSSPIVTYHSNYFWGRHGYDAVPVSNQEEIELASQAGMKWILVPEGVKTLLRMVRSWFIPTTKSPVEQLRDFRKKHEWRMTTEMKHDLDEIIISIDPK